MAGKFWCLKLRTPWRKAIFLPNVRGAFWALCGCAT